MKKVKNIFGEGNLYDKNDLGNKIYATSAACMSVWSDMLSFANKEKERFPIIRNNCITRIMHSKNINYIDNINNYIDMNITNYRLELFDETYKEIDNIIKELTSKITN